MTDKPHHPLNADGELRAFFGRRVGKKLHAGQDKLFKERLPELSVTLPEGMLDPVTLFPNKPEQLIVEIGYGGAEHLIREAVAAPNTGFIGCEVYSGGIAKAVQQIDDADIANIRLFTDDALKLLLKLPDASLDGVYLLYPDPWPKTRHHKRRFVSPTTLDQLARVIRPGGWFRFATDIEDYADWTLAHALREPRFRLETAAPGDWHIPYPGWAPTRYERKARREGRLVSFYFTFRRD